jgi:hypothetical protein
MLFDKKGFFEKIKIKNFKKIKEISSGIIPKNFKKIILAPVNFLKNKKFTILIGINKNYKVFLVSIKEKKTT